MEGSGIVLQDFRIGLVVLFFDRGPHVHVTPIAGGGGKWLMRLAVFCRERIFLVALGARSKGAGICCCCCCCDYYWLLLWG